MQQSEVIIATDLDGTLLDHDTYQWQVAKPALTELARRDIPVVIVTSKTVAEIVELRKSLGNEHPFIAENGGVLCVPDDYFAQLPEEFVALPEYGLQAVWLGAEYHDIRAALDKVRQETDWQFRGFGDMTDAEVADLTSMDMSQATLARQRLSSEPLLWQDRDLDLPKFIDWLYEYSLQVQRGGRFLHVTGHSDKGRALNVMCALWAERPQIIALGDSSNDLPLFDEADQSFLVQRGDGTHIDVPVHTGVQKINAKGPEGWNQAVLNWLAAHG